MAREALANEDRVLSENYFQHADHFTRIQNEQESFRVARVNSSPNTTTKLEEAVTKDAKVDKVEDNADKKIISDHKKSLTYSQLINLALSNSRKIKEIKSDFIPIIVERNVDTVVAILSVIFSKKIFCPISNKFPN